ncbi:MAG: SDR family oxidoreductase [Candidatus Altiarchaeia archaeon]
MSERILVTGGAGFIGSNLCEKLLAEGNSVTALDNLSTGRMENISSCKDDKNYSFVKGSVTDYDQLKKLFSDTDYVLHQAAIPSVQRSVENPLASHVANVDGTFNVLLAAKDANVRKVVYAASSSAYGDTPTLPKREDMTPNPKSPYAVTKLAGEYYCRAFTEVYGLKTITLRYFNVYGPRQNPESEYAAVIPRFITKILKGETPTVYGDGTQTRDFSYVKDVVSANIKAMESNASGVYNIAYGKRISLNELVAKINKYTCMDVLPVYDKARTGDVKDSLADITAAKEKFGYDPKYDIDKGLQETIEWFRKN